MRLVLKVRALCTLVLKVRAACGQGSRTEQSDKRVDGRTGSETDGVVVRTNTQIPAITVNHVVTSFKWRFVVDVLP